MWWIPCHQNSKWAPMLLVGEFSVRQGASAPFWWPEQLLWSQTGVQKMEISPISWLNWKWDVLTIWAGTNGGIRDKVPQTQVTNINWFISNLQNTVLVKCIGMKSFNILLGNLLIRCVWVIRVQRRWSEMEFKELEPQFKSAKTRFKLSAGLNLMQF